MFKLIWHRAGTGRATQFETLAAARAVAVPRPPVQGTEVVRETPCPTCGRQDLECDRCAPRNGDRP
jgi:hypothetical protein